MSVNYEEVENKSRLIGNEFNIQIYQTYQNDIVEFGMKMIFLNMVLHLANWVWDNRQEIYNQTSIAIHNVIEARDTIIIVATAGIACYKAGKALKDVLNLLYAQNPPNDLQLMLEKNEEPFNEYEITECKKVVKQNPVVSVQKA
ncbi:MAG: hypothetical protein F6K25_14495 [Okeania sp. SIO2G4]|uniref:hypothetical protein n=1 Tax=unclassified Okeania TaxID=2634635 RepID=UPI0013BE5822|nr:MULTISPECIES: hypothetical protein [unclassified Okeania]NEP71818.1 hypothetical protein [Okeania sp. SIO2G5]NEP92429.1 hypothetical protein [Okeania sp. SIO2F5]NEQ91831.1 hypothetical protein [Okeania sp. SIO2G4]